MLWSSRCCLGRRFLLRRSLSIVTSGSPTGRASKSCLAKFRQKFGEDKGHNYSHCVTDQTNKAIDDCVGSTEFSNCVLEKSLRVLEVCMPCACPVPDVHLSATTGREQAPYSGKVIVIEMRTDMASNAAPRRSGCVGLGRSV